MKNASSSASLQPHSRTRLWFWLVVILIFFGFLSLIKHILLPFVVGMLTAYFLDPAVRSLRAQGWPRTLSAAVITIIFFLTVMLLGLILVPLISDQLSTLMVEMPDYLQALQIQYGNEFNTYVSRLSPSQMVAVKNAVGNASTSIVAFVGNVATGAVRSGLALLNILLLVFLTPVVAFYLLRDWEVVTARFDEMLPRAEAGVIHEQLSAINRALSGFIRGQTNVCLIMASYYGITLTLVGLKFGLGLGIMTGLLLFIPFVGYATGFTTSIAVALFQFGLDTPVFIVLAIYLAGLLLESGVITPRLVGSKVGLHPLWIIFGMLAGGTLFGFVGVLIAVPVTTVIGVLTRFAIQRYLKSAIYTGKD